MTPKMQKPVSKEKCPTCGEPLDHYHAVDQPSNAVKLPPKLTPIDKGMLIGFHNPITPILALADKVNEIINLINGETDDTQ